MIAKPIPLKLLIHTISYEEYYNNDGLGSGYKAPITINYVRVDPITSVTRSSMKNDVEGDSVIFIDRTHSTPYLRLKEKSKITFKEKNYEVVKVKTLYDSAETPHHYEVIIK